MSITDLQDNKRFILDAHAMSIKSARELKTVHGQTVASMTKKMMKDFWLICKGAGASKDNRWAMPRTSRAQAAERFVESASVGWLGAAEAAGEPGQQGSHGIRAAMHCLPVRRPSGSQEVSAWAAQLLSSAGGQGQQVSHALPARAGR